MGNNSNGNVTYRALKHAFRAGIPVCDNERRSVTSPLERLMELFSRPAEHDNASLRKVETTGVYGPDCLKQLVGAKQWFFG